eukprot:CAMPEP_0178904464 /NCGR_PEP_ID=MMETSP0786-20121207/5714_1 /TAXON_ID=186022 /ORGANISM="Thalassionema frauenfeldii, Strain CCMP 1798" /LENGTH=172 /DNA_ID=CAMNT_0020575923 /DNA_START=134 /DNA_END=652 /DNA_ORIENTATION=+
MALLLCGARYLKLPAIATAFSVSSLAGSSRSAFHASSNSRLFSSSPSGSTLTNIGFDEMKEIVEDYEQGGREDSGYLVMDVREYNEVEASGKISPTTQTLPLSIISQQQAFEMDAEEFESLVGFPKPTPEETLVFSCAAGIRSVTAAQWAAQAGFTQLVNYQGGASEWFSVN